MMTKPPGFASSSTLPLDDEEESIDESLDEILLEANERPAENSAKSLEAVPSALSDDDSDAESAPSPPGEVTVLAPRPTFFDEVREEASERRRVGIRPLRAVERIGDDLHFGRIGKVAHVDDLAAPDDVEAVIAFRLGGDLGRRRGGRRRILENGRRAAREKRERRERNRTRDKEPALHA